MWREAARNGAAFMRFASMRSSSLSPGAMLAFTGFTRRDDAPSIARPTIAFSDAPSIVASDVASTHRPPFS